MKIPFIISQQEVPGPSNPPYMQQSPDLVRLAPVAQLGQHMEASGTQLIKQIRAVEDLKRHEEQVNEALGGLLRATNQNRNTEFELQRGKFDPLTGDVIEPPVASRDYLSRWQESWKNIRRQTLESVRDPVVRPYLNRLLLRSEIDFRDRAARYADALFTNEQTAELNQLEDETLKVTTDPTLKEEDQNRYAELYKFAVSSKQGLLGPVEVQRRLEKFDERVQEARADKDIDSGVFTREKYQGKIDPAKLDRLEYRAASVVARAQVALDKSMRNWAESVDRQGSILIASRKLTPEFLDTNRDAFTGEKLLTYYKALEEQRFGSSGGDESTIEQLTIALGNRYDPSVDPRITLMRIDRAYINRQIGLDRYGPWSSQLNEEIQRRKSEGKATQTESETRRRQLQADRFQQANKQIDSWLQQTGVLNFDNESATAIAQFRDELARRADYLGEGNEDSLLVYRQELPKYLGQISDRGLTAITSMQGQTPYRSLTELENDRKRIGEDAYRHHARILTDIRAIERSIKHFEENVKLNKGALGGNR